MKKTNDAEVVFRARKVAIQLLGELETLCNHGDALTELCSVMDGSAAMNDGTVEGQIAETWRQVTSLPARIEAVQKLSEAMKALGMVASHTGPEAG